LPPRCLILRTPSPPRLPLTKVRLRRWARFWRNCRELLSLIPRLLVFQSWLIPSAALLFQWLTCRSALPLVSCKQAIMHQGLTQRMSADASRLVLTRRIRCRLVVGPVADTRI